jgi:competence protein ComEC
LTNLLAVPLSSLILLGEILLCALAIVPTAAGLLGRLLTGMIAYMNTYIENMDRVRFALWEGIQVSALQTTLLMAALAAITLYLLHKKKAALPFAFGCAALFLLLRTHSFLQADGQQKLIVYQVPKHRAIDVIEGRQYHFLGDSVVQQDELLRAYHLQPSRILHRVAEVPLANTPRAFTWSDKQVLIIDTTVQLKQEAAVRSVDLLILSGNPKLYMQDLVRTFLPKQIVADASVPRWKAVLWKRDCDSLRIPFHDVSAKGAFVMTL